MTTAYSLKTLSKSEMAKRNKEAGQHWFDRDTMQFFNSRIESVGYITEDGSRAIFVSSEQNKGWMSGTDYPRLFTLRQFNVGDSSVDTVGGMQGFQKYKTKSDAMVALKQEVRV